MTRSSDPVHLYESRVKGRNILLENPVRENRVQKEREEKTARRAAAKKRSDADVIANNTARRKGLWKVSSEERRYVCAHHNFIY